MSSSPGWPCCAAGASRRRRRDPRPRPRHRRAWRACRSTASWCCRPAASSSWCRSWRSRCSGARPGSTGRSAGAPLPAPLATVLDAPALRTVLRAAMLLLADGDRGVRLAGPQDPDANPAPRALYVLFWVGIVPASLLFGPGVAGAQPAAAAAPARRRRAAPAAGRGRRPARPASGTGPAAVGLALFVALELVVPGRDRPAVVAGFLLGLRGAAHRGRAAVRARVVRPWRRVRGVLDAGRRARPGRAARRRPARVAQPAARARGGRRWRRGWSRSSRSGGGPRCSTG